MLASRTWRVSVAALSAAALCACGSGALTAPEEQAAQTIDEQGAGNGDGSQSSDGSASGDGTSGDGASSSGDASSSGNGSESGEESRSGGTTGSSGPDGSGGGEPEDRFDWVLPATDTSVTGNEGPTYAALQRSCDEGEAFLRENWRGLAGPRNVLLYMAGVQACRGDRERAAEYTQEAAAYGFGGLAPEGDAQCDLYKSLRSVLEQRPREDFPCPGGSAPPFVLGAESCADNPLTRDVDEQEFSVVHDCQPPPDSSGGGSGDDDGSSPRSSGDGDATEEAEEPANDGRGEPGDATSSPDSLPDDGVPSGPT